MIADDLAAALGALPQAFEEADHLGRPWLWHGEEGHLLEPQLFVAAGGEGVDLLLADEQGDIVTAFGEHLAHGDAWKQMTSRASARDEDMDVGLFRFQGW